MESNKKVINKLNEKNQRNNLLKTKNIDDFIEKKKSENNGKVFMTYRIDRKLLSEIESKYDKFSQLFGYDFVKKNKDKCKIIIANKEYPIAAKINLEDFEYYGINEEDEIINVTLKGESISDMSWMFFDCRNLIKVDFSSFNSEDVMDMSFMFYYCENLMEVSLLFNTENVKNMESMFSNCKRLIKVDLSSLNTKNVINMANIFNRCQNLIKVDLSSLNTKNVKNMANMFNECQSLIKIDLSSFNIKNVINMKKMFNNCISLVEADLSSFKIQHSVNMENMFDFCDSLHIKINRKSFNLIKNNLYWCLQKLIIIEK